MVIGVHAVAAFRPEPTGVEVYAQELLHHMANLPDARKHRLLLYADRAKSEWRPPRFDSPLRFGSEVDESRPGLANGEVRILKFPMLWTQVRLSLELLRHSPDVLFVPAQALPRKLPKRTVAVIHGVEFKRVPSMYSRWQREYLHWITRDALSRADRIIAVSHATKHDLLRFYDADPHTIVVIHHGAPRHPQGARLAPVTVGAAQLLRGAEIQDLRSGLPANDLGRRQWQGGIRNPYFLFVGRLELKKNVDGIVRGFTRFCEQRPQAPHELVLLGAPGFGYEKIQNALLKSSVRERMKVLGRVHEVEKWKWLLGAEALVFPSWAEGFGFPILEAQAAEIPVITASVTSMPEVAGDAGALFVEPEDPEALAEAMVRIGEDMTLRRVLIEAGQRNVTRFSWESTAQETLRVLLNE